ncbi:hypothetical protein PF005_g18401 [Phytophthora fragariae]|uniref:Uncharacterized protein n=2 Tax=Phytophthora TaxID=4783 RepID=A0A6A3XNC2_9STRA|nr:hypothetical protein PF003_g24762 [Phytophthora fragariae]KAE9002762.1 hypothetical protein PR002_g17547 [Phytophthora rubi]KAE8930628.1 hypothetical protein PF009_g19281 [Phytophthora fragariae]KAE8991615.1 hypothetical protein PF011_g17878 [Phytophthora fragariae]KAE9006680.1 hypothetical protein PR001_g17144 [Phytophthora rubi]
MKVEEGQEDNSAMTASASAGETALSEMNAAFASCLSLVCPPIQYPPHCRFNPVRDAADTAEIEARLEEFFVHAKQLEQLFLNDAASSLSSMSLETADADANAAGRQQQSELELEILNLEAELAEKSDLIDKYTDVVRGWEGKFKRLDHRMSPDRE